jgi:glycosyltransferase involved in cell wall biosynthesis
MKVSIVTISFNQARYLEQAIQSVLSQEYAELEYIIVDGGSTDGSREIIERYRSQCAAVLLLPDDGPGRGLNNGVALATGDIFGYLNSDDVLLPGAIDKIVREWIDAPQVDVMYGHGYLINEHGRAQRRLRSAHFDLKRSAFGASVVVQQSTFFRRQAIVDVGGFNAANRTCWDYEILVDLAMKGKRFCRLDEYLALYRLHRHSMSLDASFELRSQQDLARIFTKIMGRAARRSDRLLRASARLEKWAVDPKSFFIRLAEVLWPFLKVRIPEEGESLSVRANSGMK